MAKLSTSEKIRREVDRVRNLKRWRPILSGGLTSGHHPREFSAASLRRGAKIEMEHTDSPRLAVEIAMGHLIEDRRYYAKLSKVER